MTSLTSLSLHRGPDLYEFLVESELEHYYSALKNDLKVNTVAQLKYVEDEDMGHLGMSRPEMRRLKKYYHKYYPQNYLLRIKKKLISKKDGDNGRASLLISDHSSASSSSDRQVKVPSKHIISADSITVNKELGVGEFGVVQQGVWTNEEGERIQVAIKKLSKERLQNNSMDFLKEASIMHSIDNEHIVRLYGVVLETNTLMLVTELAPLRSLLECLKEVVLRPSFPIMCLCEFAQQICNGMQYLESKRLIHRDLAARNILVFSKNKVKISDFGLSRALGVGKDYYQTNFNVNLKLPIAWCATECINYLRFTSASDVWAYGVTLWEMFSYGFQPWAALTGQQILEAIDEPNFQRLEQPECCPKEYFGLMVKCWQHDPNKRPKFSEILTLLPECKPEQVQAVRNFEEPASGTKARREMLNYRINDIITVLDKKPQIDNASVWKGVLDSGKTGLFNPANTVAYLGTDIPSVKPAFVRPDGKSTLYSSRRRLRPEMISCPQDDLKHTGHVGLDGAFFGDVSFLGDKYSQLPKQIVTPYKPQEDRSLMRAVSDASDCAPLIGSESRNGSTSESNWPETNSTATCSEKGGKSTLMTSSRRPSESPLTEHEYHEISDDDDALEDGKVDENYFQNNLDFGPSLMDEVFTALNCRQDEVDDGAAGREEKTNTRNEIREIVAKVSGTLTGASPSPREEAAAAASGKKSKKHATVKPISPSDAKAIDSAIAMANELATRNMLDMDGSPSDSEAGAGAQDSPHTPSSPSKRKFSFRFGSSKLNGGSPRSEKRNFSREAASIPDIQASLSEEAKEAYSSLVEKRNCESTVSLLYGDAQQQIETNPLRLLRSGVPVWPKVRGNKHSFGAGTRKHAHHDSATMAAPRTQQRPPAADGMASNHSHSLENVSSRLSAAAANGDSAPASATLPPSINGHLTSSLRNGGGAAACVTGVDSVPQAEGGDATASNLLPLPPRTKPIPAHKPRQRKHPLIIPTGNTRNLVKPSLSMSLPDVNPISPTGSCSSDGQSPALPLSPLDGGATSPSGSPKSVARPSSSYSPPPRSLESEPRVADAAAGAPAKPPRACSLDDSFDGQIQADMDSLDDIPEEDAPVPPMYRNSDHVSCEDLMDFALDRPNAKRTQGRARGIDSDEVRIMQKVLSNEVTSEVCVSALNETEWNVHKAIKYLKLQLLLSTHLICTDNCKQTLMSYGWDVQKAYNYLVATYGVTEDSTEV